MKRKTFVTHREQHLLGSAVIVRTAVYRNGIRRVETAKPNRTRSAFVIVGNLKISREVAHVASLPNPLNRIDYNAVMNKGH